MCEMMIHRMHRPDGTFDKFVVDEWGPFAWHVGPFVGDPFAGAGKESQKRGPICASKIQAIIISPESNREPGHDIDRATAGYEYLVDLGDRGGEFRAGW